MDCLTTTPSEPAKPGRLLVLGGSGFRRDDQHANRLWRKLEAAVVRSHGQLTETQQVHIWAACRAFRRCRRVDARLRDHGNEMTHAEWLSHHAQQTRFEEVVAKHIRALDLDHQHATDAFGMLYKLDIASIAPDAATGQPEATAANAGVSGEELADK